MSALCLPLARLVPGSAPCSAPLGRAGPMLSSSRTACRLAGCEGGRHRFPGAAAHGPSHWPPGRPAGAPGPPVGEAAQADGPPGAAPRGPVLHHLQLVSRGLRRQSYQQYPPPSLGCLPIRGHQGRELPGGPSKSWAGPFILWVLSLLLENGRTVTPVGAAEAIFWEHSCVNCCTWEGKGWFCLQRCFLTLVGGRFLSLKRKREHGPGGTSRLCPLPLRSPRPLLLFLLLGLSPGLGRWHLSLVPALPLTLLGDPGQAPPLPPPVSVLSTRWLITYCTSQFTEQPQICHSIRFLLMPHARTVLFPLGPRGPTPHPGSQDKSRRAGTQPQCPDSKQCSPWETQSLLPLWSPCTRVTPKLSTSAACPRTPHCLGCAFPRWGSPASPEPPLCPQVVFRYALAIFKYNEEEILRLRDSLEIYQYLRFFTKTICNNR